MSRLLYAWPIFGIVWALVMAIDRQVFDAMILGLMSWTVIRAIKEQKS